MWRWLQWHVVAQAFRNRRHMHHSSTVVVAYVSFTWSNARDLVNARTSSLVVQSVPSFDVMVWLLLALVALNHRLGQRAHSGNWAALFANAQYLSKM